MECDRATGLLSPLLDAALGPLARLRVGRHVAGCGACAARLEELRAMQAAIRTNLPYHRAPPGLAARIGAALEREAPPAVAAPAAMRQPWFRWPAFGMAGTGLAGALAGVALTVLVLGGRPDGQAPNGQTANGQTSVALSVIGSHIRSMQADHLTDVLTSDQHTVKPWLSERLDVSPPVRDLKDVGFPLVGGRLDYVDGHRAAAVVYRRAKHVINLFAWASPGAADETFHTAARQGFNLVTWRRGGITYYAVSDVEADQLAEFARLVAQGA
jgi:anti-sigma factor RsiW